MKKKHTIENAVCQIKQKIEKAIRDNGVKGKNALIRSQDPICILHDAAKASFIEKGVDPSQIFPAFGMHKGEKKLAGFLKNKDQDICLLPKGVSPRPETLNFPGMLKGTEDPYGFEFTQRTLSVNVRSQLSSMAKNFDTLYERTFAEALNLHLRCEKMVLGELYMIPVYEYDSDSAKRKKVAFKDNANVSEFIQKYIYSFDAVNNRSVSKGEEYKYERVCLLIVDFSKSIPKIYNTDDELKEDGLLPEDSKASINEMKYTTFTDTLLKVYSSRFGKSRFK